MKYIATASSTDRGILSGITAKMKKNGNFKVNGLYAADLMQIEKSDSELFKNIAEMIKSGRWCPFAGAFKAGASPNSVSLIKSCLYSADYFKRKFGTEYKVFHGKSIGCNSFAQTVYSSLFDSAVLDDEKNSFWLSCSDGFRTLVFAADNTIEAEKCDDEFIFENEFETYEEHSEALFSSALNLKTVHVPFSFDEPDKNQAILLNAEKTGVYSDTKNTEELQNAWISLLTDGDTSCCFSEADKDEKPTGDDDIFKVCGDGIELSEIKYAEDGSGDVVIRVRETRGAELGAYIMCDKLNAGFRFEIMPYEIQTFRIRGDGTGTVSEIYICE